MIIEDDYNGEFRYFARPIGALQGLAGGAMSFTSAPFQES
jgi:DNA-binding transcriptional MocR family regulator